ncbi:NAD(P)-dependent oxidoreductase [Bacteroidota bacterium]
MVGEICVLDTGYKSYDYEERLFRESGYEFRLFDGLREDLEEKLRFARNATGIFIRWIRISEKELAMFPNLKVIVRYGTGYENINLEACRKAGVKVANVSGYANHSVSNHALAFIYACSRDLLTGNNKFASIFAKPPDEKVFDLNEKTLGIVGLGRIGTTLASKARYLFKKVLATDPYIEDDKFNKFGVIKTAFKDLLSNSDFISIHCNLTEETRHMFNQTAFEIFKANMVLVNTARGPVIETNSLLKALDSDKIFRAGLDVFDSELPEEIPESLVKHPKVIATGHYAWYSVSSHLELQKRAADNMLGLLEGKEVEDCLVN